MTGKTIAAISTPTGVGGIGTIRISGENAIEIASKIFRPVSGKNLCDFKGYTAAFGGVYDNDEKIDEAVLNGRLSREFLGSSLSYRRVPNNWTEVYLRGQATCFDQVKVTLWKGIEIVKTALQSLQ